MGLLSGKNAVIYGGAGAIGAVVAYSYAREGARVFLAGRTLERVEHVAASIRQTGALAEAAQVDASDHSSLQTHAKGVLDLTGQIDVVFNATSNQDVQGTPLLELSHADFVRPCQTAVTIHFLISTVIGRYMATQGSGVILAMAGDARRYRISAVRTSPGRRWPGCVASSRANWARRGSGLLGSSRPGSPEADDDLDADAGRSILGRLPRFEEVAKAATFLASDMATTMTATELNITGGAIVD